LAQAVDIPTVSANTDATLSVTRVRVPCFILASLG